MQTVISNKKTNSKKTRLISTALMLILFWSNPLSLKSSTISGTFTTLSSSPMNLTCFTVDPTTGYFYGQGDQGSTNYYRYIASTNTWSTLAACPQSSGNNGGATYLNGKIYNSYCGYNVITVYTISTNSWTTISGGLNSGNISNDGTNIFVSANGVFKKYVISTGTWVTLTGTACQPWGGLQYKNGFFYLHVGNDQVGFKRYEVITDTWTTLTNVPGGAVLGSAIYDAYYYCQGPYYGSNLYSYDLGAGEWNNTLTLPFTTNDAAIVTYGNSLYIVQGEAGTKFTKFTPNNPMLTNIESTPQAYNIGDAASVITSTITASQNSGTNFQSATVSVTANFQTGKDVLSFVNAFGITGSWNASTGVLTLTGTTTIADYQSALRTVKYSNSDATSTNLTRTVSFKVYDGSQYSNTANRNIYFPGPPIMTTTAVTSITMTTASSGGFVSEDGGTTVIARGVCWSTTSGATITDSKTTDGSGLGSFTSSLTGLTPGATYYIRAYATNSSETGYGNEQTFTTLVPAITVSTTSLSGFTACIGGAASSPLTFTVSGVYLSENIIITAPSKYEVSTSSGSGYTGSVTLTQVSGTVNTTTIYTRLLTSTAGTITENISVTSNGVTSKTVALSGTVSPLAVGGTLSGSSPVTYGSSSGTITLSGHSGTIKRWEKKLGTGTWSSIVSTAITYSESPSSAGTWYYRAVIGSGACSDAYSSEFILIVAQKILTVTGAEVTSKPYNGNTSAVITGGTLTGIVGADVVTLENNTTGTFAQANSGTGISVSTAMTLTGINSTNYTLTQPTLSGSITKVTLTVTADNKSRDYGEANPAFTLSYTGFVNSETSSVLDVLPTASTPAVVTSNTGTYSITPSGGSDINYSYSFVNGTLTINKATLTATPDDKTRIYGDANPTLTINYTGFLNSDTESAIDTKPVTSTAAILTSNVGSYAISASGGSDNNYTFSFINGALAVTKAGLSATADNKTKDYGQANPSFTISYAGFKNSETSSVLDVAPVASTTATLLSNAGTYVISLSSVTDNNYTVTSNNGTLEISKSVLTATADAKTKVYGEENPALTLSYSGFLNGDNQDDLDTAPVPSTAVTTASDAGTYPIILSAGSDNNYDLVEEEGTLTVSKATISVTADDKTKAYGEANPALTISYSGFVNADDQDDIDVKPSTSTLATAASNAGSYPVTAAGGDDNNYDFSYTTGALSVTKATLTATAENKTKVYGSANPELSFSYSGFVNSDDMTVIDTEPSIATTADLVSAAGSYPITISGGMDNNYNITLADAVLSVTKAALTSTADNKSKTYGEENPALTLSYSGFLNGDDQDDLDTAPVPSTAVTTASDAGTYPIILSAGSDNNYDLVEEEGTLTVSKATISVTADDKTRAYGEANPVFTVSLSGFVIGDDQNDLDVIPVPATIATASSDAGIYDIEPEGGSDNNYEYEYIIGRLTVSKADQAIVFTPIPSGLRATQNYEMIATSTSGLPVSFISTEPDIAFVSGDNLEIVKEGSLQIIASQEGNHNWNAATDEMQNINTLPTFDNIRSLFTPNNDGMNDYWYIPYIEQYGKFSVQIYNRFGKLLYESSAYKNDWDGTYNGTPLPSASYYYLIKSDVKGIVKGVVNIVR